jgi:hypothetical protein
MLESKAPIESRYLRTTWLLRSKVPLHFPDLSKVRLFEEDEATQFARTVRRSNVFARHSPENFYLKRVAELANRTIIEVRRPGKPDDTYKEAERVAELVEKVAVLSTTLILRKDALLRKLAISPNIRPEIDFISDSKLQFVRSRSQRVPSAEGIVVDKQFCARFSKCGFFDLFEYCQGQTDLANRVRSSADWLLESRREARLTASVVKTSIALESLLIFSESESLARSLSERAAFMLSSSPDTRQEISRVINQFYEVRSGIVHGSRKKVSKLSSSLVECVDRLCLLLQLIVSANSRSWTNVDDLRKWCEKQRWGGPSRDVRIPFSGSYLNSAFALIGIDAKGHSAKQS